MSDKNKISNCSRSKRIFFVLSAPSGCGKTTLSLKLLKDTKKLKRSISHTTRAKRADEVDGRDYYFISKEEFVKKRNNGEFIEWAEVHGNYYGTLFSNISNEDSRNDDLLFVIDVKGALQFKKHFSNGVYIFIIPPSINDLSERLKNRGTEDLGEIAKRVEIAKQEISYYSSYDYIIINDNIEIASSKLQSVIDAERCKTNNIDRDNMSVFK